MTNTIAFEVRAIEASDYAGWSLLYAAYAEFYAVQQTSEMQGQVWKWIHQSQPLLSGLVAVNTEGKLIGFLHYRTFVRPLAANVGGYIDDLFVLPETRGQGVAQALINTVVSIGQTNQWSVIRWVTAEDNMRAKACYEKIAEPTHWQTYEIKL